MRSLLDKTCRENQNTYFMFSKFPPLPPPPQRRGAYRALVGKPEGRSPLGRPSGRWEKNIKMDLQKVEWGRLD
jgi:hypothetical protein